jgi:2'-5' RNA ligase
VSESAVIVHVPGADSELGPLRQEHDPSASQGLECHVTVLYPFLASSELDDASLDRLHRALLGVSPFELRLRHLGRFSDEVAVLYAVPEPAEPFSEMTRAVSDQFGLTPYGGVHDVVVPHLTIAIGEHAVLDRVATVAERVLPITAWIDRVSVEVHKADTRQTAHVIPLSV